MFTKTGSGQTSGKHSKKSGVVFYSTTPTWDHLFKTLSANDPYTRQMSIHNGAGASFLC